MVTDQPETVAAADKIVLPGVGHFSSLQALNRTGLREALLQAASARQAVSRDLPGNAVDF